MKRSLMVSVLVLVGGMAAAGPARALGSPVFYVHPTGSDQAAGTSPQTAWRTLARVQTAIDAKALPAGSDVLFARGAVFAGSLAFDNDIQGSAGAPITFGAYGAGAEPVISGLTGLTGWTAAGANRWQTTCPSCGAAVNSLQIDGAHQPLARWPNADAANKGYLTIDSATAKTNLTDDALADGQNWVGGQAVVRSAAWVLDRLPIQSHSGGTLNFSQSATYTPTMGYGYFIQNHPAALDRHGEWVYEPASKRITVYLAQGAPADYTIEVSAIATLWQMRNTSHIVLRDLELRGPNELGLLLDRCSSIAAENISITRFGAEGAIIRNCSAVDVGASAIRDGLNHGLRVEPCAGCRVHHSSVERIALLAGMGQNGNGHYNGVKFGGAGAVLEYNRVSATGYLGIDIRGPATVRRNVIDGFNMVKTDGGGIYTWKNSDITIEGNIVTNGLGFEEGVPWNSPATHGIYIDDNSERVLVRGNTVATMGSTGIFLHNTRAVTVEQNLVVDGRETQLRILDDDLGSYRNENTLFRNNTLVSDQNIPVLRASTNGNESFFGTLGVIDASRYCEPWSEPQVYRQYAGLSGERTLWLGQWRSMYGFDQTTSICPTSYPSHIAESVQSGNAVANGTFAGSTQGWTRWPNAVTLTHDATTLGGSLKAVHDGSVTSNGLIYTPIGQVAAGKTYRVRATLEASGPDRRVRAYLRKHLEPYQDISARQDVRAGATPGSVELFFTATGSEAGSLVVFEIPAGQTIWLDNVEVHEVTARPITFSSQVRVLTNPSEQAQTVSLNGAYVSAAGTSYPAGSQITLQPYAGVALFRTSLEPWRVRLPLMRR